MMKKILGIMLVIIFVLGLLDVADSFTRSTRFVRKSDGDRYSIDDLIKGRQFPIFSVHPSLKEVGDDQQDQDWCQYASCPTLLTDCQPDQWHINCEDVDKTMSCLVSPAPESFHVLHSVISNIHDKNSPNTLNDLRALSSFIVKPDYSIELFLDCDMLKWRLIPRSNCELSVIYPCECIQEGKAELYHEHNALQLSRIALDLATKAPNDPRIFPQIHDIALQAEKRLALTMGSDLRGPTSSDASFNFALAGVQRSGSLFQTLRCIGVHELKRAGLRASFKPKHILQMVEKFAACDTQHAFDLYHIAGDILDKKGYIDSALIEKLKDGNFGFHCERPLIWLWRFSSRQKKVSEIVSKSQEQRSIIWDNIFTDPSLPLVVDVGSGMGASLLNLSTLISRDESAEESSKADDHALQMTWSGFNYVGADLNLSMVNFGNGIISRDSTARRTGRAHFFCLSAEDFLIELHSYPGSVALIMINFPSPFRLAENGAGNSQLPSKHSNRFMVSKEVLASVAGLLSNNSGNGLFLFQTKCEDVAVHVKNDCLSLGTLECIPCNNSVDDIEHLYKTSGKRPKRVDEWLKATPSVERAEGRMFSNTPLLPKAGRPETEVQCNYENTVVHRCIFRRKG